MNNRLKPNQPITYYHIVTRCAQQKFWLEKADLKQLFINLLDRLSQIYYVDVLAHTIMDTHVHLCLAVRKPEFDEADVKERYEIAQGYLRNPRPFHGVMANYYYHRYSDLSCFVGDLKWHFSHRHNKLMKTKGTVWEGRFKSMVIEDGNYLMQAMTYIDLNPVRAQMVKHPDDFEFGSIYRIKEALMKGETDPTPTVGPWGHLPDGERGEAYLALGRYLATLTGGEENQKGNIPEFIKFWIGSKLLNQTIHTFKQKSLTNWGNRIFGSESFTQQTMKLSSIGATKAGRSAIRKKAPLRRSAIMAHS